MSFFLTGRLRPGVTFAEGAVQLDVLAAALAAEHPDASRHSELYVVSERDARPYPGASRHIAPPMTVMMGLASLVLLIAVANVGTLLVGRGRARRQEMALRAGLGATRRRLVRQLTSDVGSRQKLTFSGQSSTCLIDGGWIAAIGRVVAARTSAFALLLGELGLAAAIAAALKDEDLDVVGESVDPTAGCARPIGLRR